MLFISNDIPLEIVPALIVGAMWFVSSWVMKNIPRRLCYTVLAIGGVLGFLIHWQIACIGAFVLGLFGLPRAPFLQTYEEANFPPALGCLVGILFGSTLAGLYVLLCLVIEIGPATSVQWW